VTSADAPRRLVVALSGGIGGAKLALGLARVLPPGDLMVVANTGDDFEHLGLTISPDVDTLMYTLSGLADETRGWGRSGETWAFMEALAALGGETWFQLGDADLAVHVERTRRLKDGETLSQVTRDLCRRLGIDADIVPMSDDRVRTRLKTSEGWLDFQDYFVRRRSAPSISDIAFAGADTARPHADFIAALSSPRTRAIVLCPSNPYISIGPILALPGVRQALATSPAPVVGVTPIIGGQAVKGPTAKMMAELGVSPDATSVARLYDGLIDGFIADEADKGNDFGSTAKVVFARTLMSSLVDRERLARTVLDVADAIARA
jgi:LPPG:FO 2-phospho-L-lactate transferase